MVYQLIKIRGGVGALVLKRQLFVENEIVLVVLDAEHLVLAVDLGHFGVDVNSEYGLLAVTVPLDQD